MTFFAVARRLAVGAVATVGLSLLVVPGAHATSADQTKQTTLVNPVPADFSPMINDGTVFSMAEVDGHIVIGGDFTNASPVGDPGTVFTQPDAMSFDETTGALDTTGFLPSIDGRVNSVIPGPGKHQVYVGGNFSMVDGKSMRVALLNLTTGHVVHGWNPPAMNQGVNKLVLADGQLFVGGAFTTIGSDTRKGLASLNPMTGKVTSYLDLDVAGHHNYQRQCNPNNTTCATGHPGVRGLAVSPDGSKMIVTGNFVTVDGLARDQVAMVDLGGSTAIVDPKWATLAFTARCFSQSFDSYIRDVAFSPNGKYFVIAATGGIGNNSDGTYSSCDSASRYDTADKGSNVRPAWIAYTGEDSIWTEAITGTTVYVGGHQRWLNNRYGQNVAGPGAVPRPGIAALNPKNGLPYSWNPGRNPRGAGCFALLATKAGLWIGSDTDYIGDRTYLRPKVAFFPLTDGEAIPAEKTEDIPGRLFEVGATASGAADPGRFDYREFNGDVVGAQETLATGIDWSQVRGAFTVDGELIYGKTDGNLYERTFDGTALGPEVEIAPYDDPAWVHVATGSGQTYQGEESTLGAEIPNLTSMFFNDGRLYYTVAGATTMFWRDFEPESGVVGAAEHSLSGDMDWSHVAGAVLSSDHKLYYADQTTGELMTVVFRRSGPKSTPKVIDANTDWASRGLFLLSQKTAPTPAPDAAFTSTCNKAGKCTFTATPWTDPDGGIVRYSWSFGDGATQGYSTNTAATHRYAANGTRHVTLTVLDTAGAQTAVTQPVTLDAAVRKISFVGAASVTSRAATAAVTVPKHVKAHDGMVLTVATSGAKPAAPKGWRLVGVRKHHDIVSDVFDRVATRHDAGSVVMIKVTKGAGSTVALTAYRHTSTQIIERSASRVTTDSTSYATPRLPHLTHDTWVEGIWSALAKKKTVWQLPHAMTKRLVAIGQHRPFTSTAVGDTSGPLHGKFAVGHATSSVRGSFGVQWSIALSPALA